MLRRTHYVSITDAYDPLSNRRAFYDSSYALPPAMCECYVENRPGKTPANFRLHAPQRDDGMVYDHDRHEPLDARAAGRGAAGVRDLQEGPAPLIQRADLYHVSERPDGRRWDGMQYYDRGTGRGRAVRLPRHDGRKQPSLSAARAWMPTPVTAWRTRTLTARPR